MSSCGCPVRRSGPGRSSAGDSQRWPSPYAARPRLSARGRHLRVRRPEQTDDAPAELVGTQRAVEDHDLAVARREIEVAAASFLEQRDGMLALPCEHRLRRDVEEDDQVGW